MTDKLELKSSHEVVYTIYVADVESIFYCKPTDPDILTVLMKDGKRLYCDEVCPVQEEPVMEDYKKARKEAIFSINEQKGYSFKLQDMFDAGANWQKQLLMKKAIEGIVTTNIDGWINVMTGFIRPEEAGANFGNKVKLIIIKED